MKADGKETVMTKQVRKKNVKVRKRFQEMMMSTVTDDLGRGCERTQDDHDDVRNDESLEHRISCAHLVARVRPNPGDAAAVTDVDVTTVIQTLRIQ